MAIWQLGDAVPQIDPTAYIHPAAQVIGDVDPEWVRAGARSYRTLAKRYANELRAFEG
jgi:hypothetical protein